MIADIEANKKLSPIVTELFLRERKRNISLLFIFRLFQSASNFKTKRNKLFYHENS